MKSDLPLVCHGISLYLDPICISNIPIGLLVDLSDSCNGKSFGRKMCTSGGGLGDIKSVGHRAILGIFSAV